MINPLEPKVWLIIGGSSPIAEDTAIELSREPCTIIIVYRHKDQKNDGLSSNFINSQAKLENLICDLSDHNQTGSLITNILKCYPKLSGLIYMAATGGKRIPFAEMNMDQIRNIFDVNVISAFHILQGLLPVLSLGKGSAVFVGSQAVINGGRSIAAYTASKAALHQMVISVAREIAEKNVRLNLVSPGVIDTKKMRAANKIESDEQLGSVTQSIPMGRIGKPLEVANAIVWLLSPAASYISGSILPVSGAR